MFHQPYRLRILFVMVVFGLALGALIGRLYYLQIVQHGKYVGEALRYQTGNIPIRPKRGNIYDRNRHALATSRLFDSLYVNTSMLPPNKPDLAFELARALGGSAEQIYEQLTKRGHLPIARAMSPEVSQKVQYFLASEAAPSKGTFYLERECQREYPKGRLASHILGFTTFDTNGETSGLAGLELFYDQKIRGNYQKFQGLRDARLGLLIPIDEDYWSAAFGGELILTIDKSIQHVAENTLRLEIAKYNAACGVVIVQKCKTGEILAMASWPDFDPCAYGSAAPEELRNRAVGHAFGLGSVMKTFTTAILFETGKLSDPAEMIDCHNGVGYFPPRTTAVRDAPGHALGVEPFRKVFKFSSNVGMVQAAQRLDRNQYHRLLSAFGFGQRTGIDLPGENPGILRPVSKWTGASMSALPYGGEMAVTPVQLVTAVSAVANGGLLMKPHIVKEIRTYEGRLIKRTEPMVQRRVLNPITSARVLDLMEDVVGRPTADGKWDAGTGKAARIDGYRIGGKTGTFPWIGNPTSYTASFVAVLPLPDPELTIFCCIDEPHGEKYGGDVAAPVVRTVAENSLRILGIPPSQADRSPTDVQLTLSRVRDAERAASGPPRGQMPDLQGMSMREVSEALAALELEVHFEGSGVVVAQDVAPYVSLRGVRECHITFGRPDTDVAQVRK